MKSFAVVQPLKLLDAVFPKDVGPLRATHAVHGASFGPSSSHSPSPKRRCGVDLGTSVGGWRFRAKSSIY